MSAGTGRAAVMSEAVVAAARDLAATIRAAEPEQLSMMPVPTRFTGKRGEHLQRASAERRGAGRPEGSQNKSTAQLRQYLMARGRHPLHLLVEWSQHTPTTLAAELNCTRLEAFRELKSLWEAAAPYFAAKLAPTDDNGNAVPSFMMAIGGAVVGGGVVPPWHYAGGPTLDGLADQTEQNQPLSQSIDTVSHGAVSHEADK